MERGSKVFVIIRAFIVMQLVHGAYLCPSNQIYQNVTKSCCIPVFNCRPGNGVVFCTINGTNDKCTPCRGGEIQPQLVSSLDGIDATCFRDETQYDCTSADMMPARKIHECKLPCQCNNDNCYFGSDPCRCTLKESRSCEVDMTMDKLTGECVKCPMYTFKNNTGCGVCRYNESEWFNNHRQGISTMFTPLTSILITDGSRYNNNRQVETSSSMIIPIPAVVAISIVVLFGVLLILACIFRKRLKEKCLLVDGQNRSADDDPASMEVLTHPVLGNPDLTNEVGENETPVMEVRPVVQSCIGAQNAHSDEATLGNSSCQREEPERDQTYVKEVVGSQTHNEEEEPHGMATEMNGEHTVNLSLSGQPCQHSYGFEYLQDQMTESVEAANDHCVDDITHVLLERSVRQREDEEENPEKEIEPLIVH
ncbi:hypothetical protein ACJMK2_008288 [Sinanodonta woodiana]|uniref:Uncharacterized protein n=1 Tax=Sinanodonta woodiana TaxID=1069815 RepID=A0ABD3VL52_SINWO